MNIKEAMSYDNKEFVASLSRFVTKEVKRWRNYLYHFLALLLILVVAVGGGYFCYVSAAASMILMAMIAGCLILNDSFSIACDMNLAAAVILPLGYFLVGFWAVDSGMFLLGGIKFLPVFLYFFVLCQVSIEKERLICMLPFLGSLMTFFSFIMMQLPGLQMYVCVGERLAGFFQYPNTYALFMLVCMLVSIYQIGDALSDGSSQFSKYIGHTSFFAGRKTVWVYLFHTLAALLGICLSGSRTVMVLSVAVFFLLLVSKEEVRKYGILCLGILAFLILILVLCGFGEEVIERLISIENAGLSFRGRLLYGQDAVKMIAQHPFGLGYYGYYFLQQEVQTGVYSVVNVHNEFVQIMLDIGILPALVVYGAIVKSLASKNISARDRLILLVIALHSLLDFDFQFLVIHFVLLLFLEQRNIKKIRVHVLMKVMAAAVFVLICVLCIPAGISDFLYINNSPEQAVRFYSGNTLAAVELLEQTSDTEELEQMADEILENNNHVSAAYSAKARTAFSKGDIGAYVKYKLAAISLAPYRYEEYTDYLEHLALCAESCLQENETRSAAFCVEQAETIPVMLEKLKERTSTLGWKTKYRPKVTLSVDELVLIKELRNRIEKSLSADLSKTACKGYKRGDADGYKNIIIQKTIG